MAIEYEDMAVHEVTDDLELYQVWPKVRIGINEIRAKCPNMLDYPEHFYHEIKLGHLKLLVAEINGNYAGFMALKTASWPDGNGIIVDTMHNASNDKEFLFKFFKILEELVRLSGYRRATFTITRKGWLPVLKKLGYDSNNSITYITKEA